MQGHINKSMDKNNSYLTNNNENPPFLGIDNNMGMHFGTRGNTSESTAFKGLVLYDLSILKETKLPFLIHDSNIIRRINGSYIKELFQLYEASHKQVFIAYDINKGTSEEIRKITDTAGVITLSKEHRLFGKSWEKID